MPHPAAIEGALVRPGLPELAAARLQLAADGTVAVVEALSEPSARRVIVPGFVNAHAHSGMAALRGLGDGLPLLDWLRVVWAAEAELSEEDILWSLRLAMCEMIRNGVTAFADMYFWSEPLIEAVIEAGLRVAPAPAIFGPGSSVFAAAGGLDLDAQFAAVERLGAAFAGHPLVRVHYGPHAVYTCGPEVFARVAERAGETGLGIQVHLSESPGELAEALAARGETPIRSAFEAGLLGERTVVAHAVQATPDDIALLAETGATVAHNPQSNLKLASGIAPIRSMLDAGVRVAIGTDGPASNDALDPLRELRLAVGLQRGALERADALDAEDGLRMLSWNGAAALGFTPTALEPGQPADAVVIDAEGSRAEPFLSPSGFVGWSAVGHDVSAVFVAGRQLLRDRELLTIDEERVRFEVRRIAARLRG